MKSNFDVGRKYRKDWTINEYTQNNSKHQELPELKREKNNASKEIL